jgi:hypothetical protein
LIGAAVDPLPGEEKQAMDHRNFDALTRAAMAEGGTRRALLRLLAGGALAGVAARLGLTEDAAAKSRKHKQAKGKQQRTAEAQRHGYGQLQAEGKRKKKRKKKRPTSPGSAAFACPGAARCQLLHEDTFNQTVALEACPGEGDGRALCAAATQHADFGALVAHLRATGFALAGDPDPLIDFYDVRQDGTRVEDVFLLRFAKDASGETVLLRYGEDPDGQQAAYAFLQQGETPTAVLAVDDDGTVTRTPVGTGGSSGANRTPARRARRAGGVGAESHDPDGPYNGQADDLCRECSVVCKVLGSIECNALVLLLSGGSAGTGAVLSPLCTKPAEAGCPSFCNSMLEALLQDDPKNCGACGASCGTGQHCCAGVCNGNQCCSDAPPPCGTCSVAVCREGGWLCQPTDGHCGRDWDSGEDICCPPGSGCDVSGKCCGLPGGCVCPIGYSPCPGWPQGCCKG